MPSITEVLAQNTQGFFRSLFMQYKMAKALILVYLIAHIMTIIGLIALHTQLAMDPGQVLIAYFGLSAIYTVFLLLSFSYFLYNVYQRKQRPSGF